MRQQAQAPRGLGTACITQNGSDFGVRQSRSGVNHGRIELVSVDITFSSDNGIAHHGQTIDSRIERAQAVGQLFRQHGNHAAREIHRGTALKRIDIQRIVGLDVVTDIGNGNDQSETLTAADFDRLAVDRIIKVTRVFTIDGHHRYVTQINTIFQIGGTHFQRQFCGKRFGCLRKLMRHTVLAYGNFDFHARIVNIAQHLGNDADRLRIA